MGSAFPATTHEELNKKIQGNLIKFIDDYNIRPGHDRRYALSCDKIKRAIGWVPEIGLDQGIQNTINWYKDNPGYRNSENIEN